MSKSEMKRLEVQQNHKMSCDITNKRPCDCGVEKKVVQYDKGRGTWPSPPEVGLGVFVYPLDHPGDYVSNLTKAYTTDVVRVEPDGTFETQNTIYVPKDVGGVDE